MNTHARRLRRKITDAAPVAVLSVQRDDRQGGVR